MLLAPFPGLTVLNLLIVLRRRTCRPRARTRRDVLVNVRLKGEAAEAAGVVGHVCELQLILLPFHQLRCACILLRP